MFNSGDDYVWSQIMYSLVTLQITLFELFEIMDDIRGAVFNMFSYVFFYDA